MAYNNGLLNFGDSFVEVGYDNEEYSVDKAQIVEKDGTVHELGGGGGGDFTIAKLTIVDSDAADVLVFVPYITESDLDMNFPHINLQDFSDAFNNKNVVLYKGAAVCRMEYPDLTFSLSGDVSELENHGVFKITGDCTITISIGG